MTTKELQTIYEDAMADLLGGHLYKAFRTIRNATESTMQYELSDALQRVEENYKYMLSYMVAGADDPGRNDMMAVIVNNAIEIMDRLRRRILVKETPTLYFSTLRTLAAQKITLQERFTAYDTINPETIVERLTTGENIAEPKHEAVESAEADIFSHIWVTFPLNPGNEKIILDALFSQKYSQRLKTLLAQALTLGLYEAFDARRLLILAKVYAADTQIDIALRMQALVGLLTVLMKYRNRPLLPIVKKQLDIIREMPEWPTHLRTVFVELIQARHTDVISEIMRTDISQSLNGMNKDLLRKISEAESAAADGNPAWEEILEKTGVADKLRRISEMQQRGGDIYMAPFAMLKTFPFFNRASNWFIPFDATHSAVESAPMSAELSQAIGQMSFLCDVDRYSLMLSMDMIPAGQRKMMLDQLEQQRIASDEEIQHALWGNTAHDNVKKLVTNHLRNAYRFHKLFRRKSEFYDPFAAGVNLLSVPALQQDFNDTELLETVAEFFFSLGYFSDALEAFTRLDSISDPDGRILEKIGFCLQKTGRFTQAADYYHQAETFNPTSQWLQQRLAEVYFAIGNIEQGTYYLEKLTETSPDDSGYALRLGSAYLRQQRYDEAATQLFKAEYLNPESTPTLRKLVITLMHLKRYDDAARYMEQIPNNEQTADDIVEQANLQVIKNNIEKGIDLYVKAFALDNTDYDAFAAKVFGKDTILVDAGINRSVIAAISDAVQYRLLQNNNNTKKS